MRSAKRATEPTVPAEQIRSRRLPRLGGRSHQGAKALR
jgi:hypothetical protein